MRASDRWHRGRTGSENSWVSDDYCYLTTNGRRTGRPHRIEIWYAQAGKTLYLLSGGGRASDWVQNILNDPAVMVDVDGVEHRAGARLLAGDSDEAQLARTLVFDKYAPRSGDDLTDWRQRSQPVALDLTDQ